LITLIVLIIIIIKQKNKINELSKHEKDLSNEVTDVESKNLMEEALFFNQKKQLQESMLEPLNITYFRKQLGISQEQLADMVGETKNTIKALEKGAYNPTLRLAKKITKALRRKNLEEVFKIK
ncbi:MAG: helix-turn-helix transcriptional regulator, partial [Nanoarchaeota archaeon]